MYVYKTWPHALYVKSKILQIITGDIKNYYIKINIFMSLVEGRIYYMS